MLTTFAVDSGSNIVAGGRLLDDKLTVVVHRSSRAVNQPKKCNLLLLTKTIFSPPVSLILNEALFTLEPALGAMFYVVFNFSHSNTGV